MRARRNDVPDEAADPGRTPDTGVGAARPPKGRPRLEQAEKKIAALQRRTAALEQEIQEVRHLNKRLAEITDVVAEVLLPAEERDEERLRALLGRYDAGL